MSTTNGTLDAMLAQYANNTKPKPTNASTVYNEKNYFNTMLPDGVSTLTKTIRILPTSDGTTPLVEIYGHQATIEGKKKTLICPKETKGLECPFCEARQALLATGTEANKELAKKYSSRKMYVVKLIDREDESHGPKFWRFNHDYRKQGIFDKIFAALQALKKDKDITNPETGRDLSMTIARDQNGYAFVQGIVPMDAEPLHTDAKVVENWLADTKTWESVYSVKPYEYLEIIVKGGNPFFDKDNKKWIDKAVLTQDSTEKLDDELSMGINNVKGNVTAATAPATTTNTPVTTTVDDDDLPF
jgi:hypothetical protein